ncbi:dihydrodipicolinate synthase family protein [Sinomicrobium weinanense]|uniref:Dihydrodipicolinate synthase family protein n=1 Tax=Sinomicrobium weinanense TaxID=2842200 RepID=A0A926JP88_9FLAO|nr:dihydrodipicolinate synthase family protein [Sinomicrobium weinanense]MBC9794957.1 dihydrodipicolinate synthase family protein [Sinomicrobium weinanense]MBU3125182.1 dihydrodipicolinate synthase family protein [Sinomicrobium weinanense]
MKIIAATYAPMQEDYSLNTEIIHRYADYLSGNGVWGVFVNGSTGDFVSLTIEERKMLIEAWGKERQNSLYVINQVGHTSLKEACELAEHSLHFADAISAIAPYYFGVKDLGKLVQYCREIAGAAPGLPFYYYHIPVLSGVDFKMSDFIKIAREEIPNFSGIKFTHNDLTDIQKCVSLTWESGKEEILFGIDEMFLSSLPFGIRGWVGSTYNHLFPLYRDILEAFNRQDYRQASDLQEKAVKFVELLDGTAGFNGAGKSFMRVFGLDLGPSRFPHNTLSDTQLKTLLEEFEKDAVLNRYFGHLRVNPEP